MENTDTVLLDHLRDLAQVDGDRRDGGWGGIVVPNGCVPREILLDTVEYC